jgi:hypothetical protein
MSLPVRRRYRIVAELITGETAEAGEATRFPHSREQTRKLARRFAAGHLNRELSEVTHYVVRDDYDQWHGAYATPWYKAALKDRGL